MYKVVEKFVSINGEGRRMGELAVFIRLAMCNLNCSYCDTKWANEETVEYNLMSKEDILAYILETKVKNVTLTGGEPLIQDKIEELLVLLNGHEDINLEIETNGSVDISKFKEMNLNKVSFTVDYKLPISEMESLMESRSFETVDHKDTVKFVISNKSELETVKAVIDKYNLANNTQVFLSPVYGQMDSEDIIEFMKTYSLNSVKLQIQLHKIIWNPEKRGV